MGKISNEDKSAACRLIRLSLDEFFGEHAGNLWQSHSFLFMGAFIKVKRKCSKDLVSYQVTRSGFPFRKAMFKCWITQTNIGKNVTHKFIQVWFNKRHGLAWVEPLMNELKWRKK